MKRIPALLICCVAFVVSLQAQKSNKAEKDFLKALNAVLKKSPQQHWNYEGKMTIDSAFRISKDGIISVTVRYKTDSSFYRVRMEAPFNEVDELIQDMYLIFRFESKLVQVYESEPNSNELKPAYKLNMLHVGMLDDGDEKTLHKVQMLFSRLVNIQE